MDSEKVVVELLARVDGFDGKVVQSATTFEGSMKRIETAAARGEGAVRKSSIGTIQASTAMLRGYEDVGKFLQSSSSPFVVPVKQAPAVASAMRVVTAGASIMGGIMGGLVASGVLAAAAALAAFILKSKSANSEIAEMVEKLKEAAEKAELARRAQDIFGNTIEGVTKAIQDQAEAHRQLQKEQRTAGELDNLLARKNLENIDTLNRQTEALINNAKAHLQRSIALAPIAAAAGSEGVADREIRNAQKQLAALEALLVKSKASRDQAVKSYQESRATLAEEAGKRAADPIAQINRQYDAEVKAAKKAAVATGEVTAALTKQIAVIERRRDAAVKAARDEARAGSSSGQSGRQINEAQARAIVASIGGTVTSGTRTAKHNEDVGGVPNSFHVKGQALDIAKTAGLTLGKIVKAFEKAGVHLIEKLDEGDHFHIAFGKRGKQGPSQETLAKRALAAADAAERREQAFQNEMATIDGQVIDARQALITSAEEIAALEVKAIEISRQKYADNVQSLVDQRKLLGDEAKELLKLNDERAKLRTELVARREAERKFRMQEADAKRALDFDLGSKEIQRDFIQSQEVLATTARQRRDQEKRLLDLQFEMERIQLQAIIEEAKRLGIKQNLTDAEQAELDRANDRALIAAQQLGTLDARKANAQTGVDQGTMPPLEDYLSKIPDTAAEINEAFESIAAGGLATFTDALTNAIVNFTSLRDVARATLQSIVAGLVKMGIQQLILHTIGQSISTASAATTVATTGAAMAAIGAAAAGPAALVSLATLGANAAPAAAALASTAALSAAIAASSGAGGFLEGGYTGNGPIRAPAGVVHGQEFVFDAAATRRIGVPALEAMRNGAVRPSNAAAVAPRGSGGTNLSQDAVATLRSIVSEAVRAVPDVAVYPTLDPGAVLAAGLSTTRGRRAFQAHMADYSDSLGAQQ